MKGAFRNSSRATNVANPNQLPSSAFETSALGAISQFLTCAADPCGLQLTEATCRDPWCGFAMVVP